MPPTRRVPPLISIILPIHNGQKWIDGCLESLLAQTILREGTNALASVDGRDASAASSGTSLASRAAPLLELSAYDDGSTDATWASLEAWAPRLRAAGCASCWVGAASMSAAGAATPRTARWRRAVASGSAFRTSTTSACRIGCCKLAAALESGPSCLLGARVRRVPEGSTPRYTAWANSMSQAQLSSQRFRECTLLMPTWFLSRAAFERGGRFREEKCEDLLFLQEHVLRGGTLRRVDAVLVEYRYHAEAVTHSTPRKLPRIEPRPSSAQCSRIGRSSRSGAPAGMGANSSRRPLAHPEAQGVAFCDVDAKKVGTTYQFFEFAVPIVHYTDAVPPFVTCVALDRTNGEFEANLASLQLEEGKDFYFFC